MSDTRQNGVASPQPELNGGGGGDETLSLRPVDIDQDMREMDKRKRVYAILNSKVFKEELERIIEAQLSDGYNPASIAALQQISDLIMPGSGRHISTGARGTFTPIADIRGVESYNYAKGEKLLRCKLASAYRLIDLFGWTESIYNHITVRVNSDSEHFLINPFGMLYNEITASSLVKVDMRGQVLEPGSTNFGISVAGFVLHSAIHQARPDVKCILHLHLPTCVAVSATKQGLMPLSQEALLLGDISYHDYCGIFIDVAERESLGRDLGPVNKVLILRNHGFVVCGESIEEAIYLAYFVVLACETQVKLMPVGIENLVLVDEDTKKKVRQVTERGAGGVNSKQDGGLVDSTDRNAEQRVAGGRKWKVGELEFEAWMRMMDNAGYRTGYIYKQPLQKSEPSKPRSDIEVPPASSSSTYIFDEDDLLKFSPLKKLLEGRRANDKTRWLNSPNVYQKVEVLETGTTDPKKITKWVAAANGTEEWVQDGSPTHSNPVKIEHAHQFVPPGTNPIEFKKLQKEIKANRLKDKITAGPQSHVLEGITWDEVKKLQDASMSGTGDQVVVVGAASKGIIQREFQHNAMVYKAPYAKNPFDCVTDEELDEYKKAIERKQHGVDEEDGGNEEGDDKVLDDKPNRETIVTPTSPMSEDEATTPPPQVRRSASARMPPLKTSSASDGKSTGFFRKSYSTRLPKQRELAVNGEGKEGGVRSAESADDNVSRSSKEGSPTKEAAKSAEKKDKKKKKGIRTPSFLKTKKKDKKSKEEA